MTTDEALRSGYCKLCGSYQTVKGSVMCVVTRLPSLNYRSIPVGQCGLNADERAWRKKALEDKASAIVKKRAKT